VIPDTMRRSYEGVLCSPADGRAG